MGYLWVDGVYVKARLEKDKAAVLVAVAGLSDETKKTVLALEGGPRESEAAWSSKLRKLKKRRLRCPRLVIGDGHLGIWAAIQNIFPEAEEQRCWNYRILNILDRISKKYQGQAKPMLTSHTVRGQPRGMSSVYYKRKFRQWCSIKGLADAAKLLDEDW